MAQKVQVILVDDIDGGEAGDTVEFGLDGVTYEIDLNQENAAELRETINQWVAHARRVGGRSKGKKVRGRSKSVETGASNNDVRTWARKNGYEVSDRGRISAEVQQAYAAAH